MLYFFRIAIYNCFEMKIKTNVLLHECISLGDEQILKLIALLYDNKKLLIIVNYN